MSGESWNPELRRNWTQAACCPAQARCRAGWGQRTQLEASLRAVQTWELGAPDRNSGSFSCTDIIVLY